MDEKLKEEYERMIKEQKLQNKALKKLIIEDKKNMESEKESMDKLNVKLLELEKENESLKFRKEKLTRQVENLQK